MEFALHHLYHVYNRGNNKQPIFFSDANYVFFLQKVRKYITPVCSILTYALMPNHFHFLIHADERTVLAKKTTLPHKSMLSEGFRHLLSSYTQAINEQNKSTGSLFQQNTKSKCLSEGDGAYAITCFHYIHQNPRKAGLVSKMEDWKYSSFNDFAGRRSGTLCNKQLAWELLDIDPATFYEDSYKIIPDEMIINLF